MSNTLLDAIRIGDLQLQLPQTLTLADGEALHCEQLLRLLPGKRGVFKARYRDQLVLAKVFLDSAARQATREHAGYQRLIVAQQPTPKLIASVGFAGGSALLYEFLCEAQLLFREDITPSAAELKRLLDRLQSMYVNGVYHGDLHYGNFFWSDATAVVIDAGAVLGEPPRPLTNAQVTDNLGLLIAQFRRCDHEAIYAAVLAHALSAHFQLIPTKVIAAAEEHWQRRKQTLLQKCFRDTTANHFVRIYDHVSAYRRTYAGAELDAFLRDPDGAMARGRALKLGNSATVVALTMDGRRVVVKRYNIKNAWHWLRRCWRPSRAWTSWRNAYWLELLGLYTPAPIAFLEMRSGPLRRHAYYVCEFIDGETLAEILQKRAPNAAESTELKRYFATAANDHLIHGDMKATNFLFNDETLAILDLDAMREVKCKPRWRKLFRQDFARLGRNVLDPSATWLTPLRELVAQSTADN